MLAPSPILDPHFDNLSGHLVIRDLRYQVTIAVVEMATEDTVSLGVDLGKYKLGWSDEEDYVFKPRKGLDEEIIREMSALKNEPQWMLDFRLRAYKIFQRKPMPNWGGDMSEIYFDDIYYYIKPTEGQVDVWEDLPEAIKNTYEKLGIPEAERKYLAGVTAQYESEVVYHRNREDLEAQGVLFSDMDSAVKEYPDIVQRYFGTIIPPGDNKFAALNSAVWSGGSFIYVPPGVEVEMPLQAYFRINSENTGQFERTLIIADEGATVHYIEGCSAPVYTTDSLHSAVVELVALPSSRITYSTIQNWSTNVFNLVTKRAAAYDESHVAWNDGNGGCISKEARVPTKDGIKTIEEVEAGDMVLSCEPSNGALVWRRVTATRFSGIQEVHRLTSGDLSIRCTRDHPFMVHNRRDGRPGSLTYRKARKIGHVPTVTVERGLGCAMDLLRDGRDGETGCLRMQTARFDSRHEAVGTYDIEVEGTGNFVCEGFIVHNSRLTMKYPAVYLMGPKASGEVISAAYAGAGQHQDTGAKMVHAAPETTSKIVSKSISKDGGRTTYRGLVRVEEGMSGCRSHVQCDALLLDQHSRSDTYPYQEIGSRDAEIGHEATVSKVADEQLFYLMSRGLSAEQAMGMVVNGFVEPMTRTLPMEYAVEWNRLIELQMEGSIG